MDISQFTSEQKSLRNTNARTPKSGCVSKFSQQYKPQYSTIFNRNRTKKYKFLGIVRFFTLFSCKNSLFKNSFYLSSTNPHLFRFRIIQHGGFHYSRLFSINSLVQYGFCPYFCKNSLSKNSCYLFCTDSHLVRFSMIP